MNDKIISFKDFLLQEKKNVIHMLIKIGLILFVMMFLTIPVINLLINYYGINVYALSVTENIDVIINFILLSTLVFSIPLLFNRIYKLISEAYDVKINKSVWYMSILAIIGFMIGITFIAKQIIIGLIGYGVAEPMISIKSTLNFAISMGFAMALALQLMFIIPILSKFKVISYKKIIKNSGWIIIALYFVVAWITPTDLTGNLFILLPCVISTGVGTFIAYKQEKKYLKNMEEKIKC